MLSLAMAKFVETLFSSSNLGSSQVPGCRKGRMVVFDFWMQSPNSTPRDGLKRKVIGKSADPRVYKTAASFLSLAGNQKDGYSIHSQA